MIETLQTLCAILVVPSGFALIGLPLYWIAKALHSQ